MTELVDAERVRRMLECLEAETTTIYEARPVERGARLLRLKVVLQAARHADQPMAETLAGVCEALEGPPPPLLRG